MRIVDGLTFNANGAARKGPMLRPCLTSPQYDFPFQCRTHRVTQHWHMLTLANIILCRSLSDALRLSYYSASTAMIFFLMFFVNFFFIAKTQNPNSTSFVFNGFRDAKLTTSGMANVYGSGILELTNSSQFLIGRAFYPTPVQLFSHKNKSNIRDFSTQFVISIAPKYPMLSGHGVAFLLSPTSGLAGGLTSHYFGMFNATSLNKSYNHVFAVEFDTARNAELQDINDNHIGIDINSLVSTKAVPAGYRNSTGGITEFNLKADKYTQCWINYSSGVVNVSVAPNGVEKPPAPLISVPINLSSILSDTVYVGFSASTGTLSGSHSVLGWSFSVGGLAQDLDLDKIPEIPLTRSSSRFSKLTIGLCVAAGVLACAGIISGGFIILRMRGEREVIEDWELEYGPHRLTYAELKQATRNFSDTNLLGFGGFGRVYKGIIPDTGLEVAVKKVSHGSNQGIREFVAEIACMGRLRHRNLVQLQGWCRHKCELLLVYDYMPNGSLDGHLFDEEAMSPILSWEQRYVIICGVASGLLYLHEEWEQRVLHRDVKASNVLLDAEFNGHLADFGLARLYEHGSNPHTTRVVGTVGYLAPELIHTSKSTTATDVYSFGALMLEVACGRRPVDPRVDAEEMVLLDWLWELHSQGKLIQAVDPRLGNSYDAVEAEMVLHLGLWCSHPHPDARPNMRQVVQMLARDRPVPELPADPPALDTSRHNGPFEIMSSSTSLKMVSFASFSCEQQCSPR